MTPGLEHLVHSVVWKGTGEVGDGVSGAECGVCGEMQWRGRSPRLFLLDISRNGPLARKERIPFFCKVFLNENTGFSLFVAERSGK